MLHLLVLEPAEKEQEVLAAPGVGLVDCLVLLYAFAARIGGLSQTYSGELYKLQHVVEPGLLEIVVEGVGVYVLRGQATIIEVKLDICDGSGTTYWAMVENILSGFEP